MRDLAIFLLKLSLKLIASEASEEKIEKISVLDIKKIIGPRPLGGGGAPGAPPLDPLVVISTINHKKQQLWNEQFARY